MRGDRSETKTVRWIDAGKPALTPAPTPFSSRSAQQSRLALSMDKRRCASSPPGGRVLALLRSAPPPRLRSHDRPSQDRGSGYALLHSVPPKTCVFGRIRPAKAQPIAERGSQIPPPHHTGGHRWPRRNSTFTTTLPTKSSRRSRRALRRGASRGPAALPALVFLAASMATSTAGSTF